MQKHYPRICRHKSVTACDAFAGERRFEMEVPVATIRGIRPPAKLQFRGPVSWATCCKSFRGRDCCSNLSLEHL